jgi:hypothetical protein
MTQSARYGFHPPSENHSSTSSGAFHELQQRKECSIRPLALMYSSASSHLKNCCSVRNRLLAVAAERVSGNLATKSSTCAREIASAESMPWSARWARSYCIPRRTSGRLALVLGLEVAREGCRQAGEVAYARHCSLPIYPPRRASLATQEVAIYMCSPSGVPGVSPRLVERNRSSDRVE